MSEVTLRYVTRLRGSDELPTFWRSEKLFCIGDDLAVTNSQEDLAHSLTNTGALQSARKNLREGCPIWGRFSESLFIIIEIGVFNDGLLHKLSKARGNDFDFSGF